MLSSSENLIDREKFCSLYFADNCEAVTLKLKPIYWIETYAKSIFERDFCKYCDKREIGYLLIAEYGEHGNYHWHGIMTWPHQDVRKRFQTWFNKYFGKFHSSDKGDANGWYNYITKGCPLPQYRDDTGELQKPPYFFDPAFEPLKN